MSEKMQSKREKTTGCAEVQLELTLWKLSCINAEV